METIETKKRGQKRRRGKKSFSDLWNNGQWPNICVTGVSERERRKKGA